MVYVALENIRSLYNVGAIMRTCSFFGIKNVLLVGYSGKHILPSGKVTLHEKLLKTDLGSENDLNIIFLEDSAALINLSKERQLELIAIEQSPKAVDLQTATISDNSILVFGNEKDGVSKLILDTADEVVQVTRPGKHNSLNVATTAGIVIFQITST